jgi:predicted alpha-1,6-mannanase (GH76 family)
MTAGSRLLVVNHFALVTNLSEFEDGFDGTWTDTDGGSMIWDREETWEDEKRKD